MQPRDHPSWKGPGWAVEEEQQVVRGLGKPPRGCQTVFEVGADSLLLVASVCRIARQGQGGQRRRQGRGVFYWGR